MATVKKSKSGIFVPSHLVLVHDRPKPEKIWKCKNQMKFNLLCHINSSCHH